MSKKPDPYLKILQKLSQVSNLQSPKPNHYNFLYSPKRLSGHYQGCSFELKLVLPSGFPETAPQIYFLDAPYHLNINSENGQFSAGFLGQDWCSFMTFEMIFQEINSLLEKPDQKYPASEELNDTYSNNQKLYVSEIKKWKELHGFSPAKMNSLKIDQQKHINNAKKSQIESVISFPQTNTQFEFNSIKKTPNPSNPDNKNKNKIPSIHNSSSGEIELGSPPLRKNSTSPLILKPSGKLRNTQTIPSNTSLSMKYESSNPSREISKQNSKVDLNEQFEPVQTSKQLKSSKRAIKPSISVSSQQIYVKNQNMAHKKNEKSSINKNQSRIKEQQSPGINELKQKRQLQKKQTLEIRNLFKDKSRSRSDKNDGTSIMSIHQKFDQQNDHNRNSAKQQSIINVETISQFEINIRDYPNDAKNKKGPQQVKTARKMGQTPSQSRQNPSQSRQTLSHSRQTPSQGRSASHSRQPSESENKQILSQSIKTIRLAEKIDQVQLDAPSIKIHLEKVVIMIRALINQCNYLEKMMESSESQTYKKILQTKIQQQAQFIEKLENLGFSLKKSLVQHLTTEVQGLLSK